MPPSLPGAQWWGASHPAHRVLVVAWIRPQGPGRPEEGFPTAAEVWGRSGAEIVPVGSAPPAP